MTEPLRPSFELASAKGEFPKYLPDIVEEKRVKLSFATSLGIIGKNTKTIGVMEWSHSDADKRDQLIGDEATLAVLSQNGFNKVFVEVSPDHSEDIEALKRKAMSPTEFAASNRIWAYGDKNYVRDSFAPMIVKAHSKGVSVEAADMAEKLFQREIRSMTPDDLSSYTDIMGHKTLLRIFPEMARSERDELWLFLLDNAMAATETDPSLGQGKEMTDEQMEKIQKIIDMTFKENIYSGRPNVKSLIDNGEDMSQLMLSVVQQMQWVESTIERAGKDPVTAKYIREQSDNGRAVVVMGAEHFLHQNGLQNSLQPMVRISLWASRDDFENFQAVDSQQLLSKTIGRKAELGELVYFIKEKEVYTTDTTPPDIAQQLRMAENAAKQKPAFSVAHAPP